MSGLAEFARPVSPHVDIGIMLALQDARQRILIGTLGFLVRTIPRRPKDQRQRAVARNDVDVVCGEGLLAPIAGGRDDGLFLTDHFFEVLDRLERDPVLAIAKVYVGAGVSALCRNDEFTCLGRTLDGGRQSGPGTSRQEQDPQRERAPARPPTRAHKFRIRRRSRRAPETPAPLPPSAQSCPSPPRRHARLDRLLSTPRNSGVRDRSIAWAA